MSEVQQPLTPPECDLTDFQYMELDVRRLRDSKFAATPNGDAFRAGIMLWCAAWHQIPAASLPDDDVELANLAGYGRMPISVKEWKKVRAEALYGFVKCTDGRLYHPVIAEKAIAAFDSKRKYAYEKYCDRLRKENAKRAKEGKQLFGIPSRELWNSGAYPHGIPPEQERFPAENAQASAGNPDENALRGNRTEQNGEGTEPYSVTDVTGGPAAKSPAELTKDELWKAGKSLLSQAGLPAAQCGSFVGKLVKDYGDQIVVDAVRTAVTTRPADPVEYLKATCMHAAKQRAPINRQEALEQRNRNLAADWAAQGEPHAAV